MACTKCETADCILAYDEKIENGEIVFTDLRFDVENRQLDINFGLLGKNNRPKESYWSYAVNIKFCPFCGEQLPEIE